MIHFGQWSLAYSLIDILIIAVNVTIAIQFFARGTSARVAVRRASYRDPP